MNVITVPSCGIVSIEQLHVVMIDKYQALATT